MGSLRFILAAAVAMGHSGLLWGYSLYPSVHAVQIFYIISGFLIAFVLNEKYAPGDLWLFYSNRALRIYIPYLFVYVAALAAVPPLTVMFGKYPEYAAPLFQNAATFDLTTWLYVAFSSLAILGQDVGLWLGFDGHLFFTSRFADAPVPAYTLQLLPQAWSISIELMFYAIAPFIVRRNLLVLLAVVIGCYALRIVGHEFGLKGAPWNYRFFPFELALFVSGAVGYRLYALTRHWAIWREKACAAVTGGVLVCVLLWFGVEHQRALYACMALAMPFLFLFGARHKLDGWLGELSYPIYLIHWPMQFIVSLIVAPKLPLGVWSVPATIAASLAFVVFVDRPLDRMRQRRLRNRGATAVVPAPAADPVPSSGVMSRP